MIPEFHQLDDSEMELVLKAPILVCILIAGADGTIDRKEINEAIAVVKKQNKGETVLSGLFRVMAEDFEDKIKVVIQSYPYQSTQRTPLVIEELAQLSQLWNKLDKPFAHAYYNMLKDLAGKVASSSGGLWGIKTITPEEAQYIGLPMVADPAKN
jgi:hypothetical protein